MRLWKEILTTIEGLLVPPLSDRPTEMRPLSEKELDVVYKWLGVSGCCPLSRLVRAVAEVLTLLWRVYSSSSASSTAPEKAFRSRTSATPNISVRKKGLLSEFAIAVLIPILNLSQS